MFGQQQQSAFGTTAFGATGATGGGLFGAQTTKPSLFGATQQTAAPAAGGLFGQANTQQKSIFGQTGSAFGTTATAAPAAGGSLFGQTANKPLFGQTGSAFGTTTAQPAGGTSLFGQQQQQQQQPGMGGGLFGQSAAVAVNGTAQKFEPLVGTDTMMKGGIQTSAQTKHQCITAMEVYKNKSLEELRCEDYVANRKGPQAGGAAPAAGAFGFGGAASTAAASTGGLFGTTAAAPSTSLFGQTQQQNKGLFGATSTASTGLFGQTQQPAAATGGLFGQQQQPGSVFGQTSAAPAGGLFGAKPATTGGLFGQTQGAFGTTTSTAATGGLFGNTAATANKSLFGNTAAAAPFSQQTTATPGGLFGQTATSAAQPGGLFGQKPAASAAPAFGAFGQTAQPGFGQTSTTGGLFGNTTSTAKPLFGATTTTSTGGLFGATSVQQPVASTGLFGQTAATGGGLFAQQAKPAFTGFGGAQPGAFGQTGGMQAQTQVVAAAPVQPATIGMDPATAALQQSMLQATLVGMSKNPYGDSPLSKLLKSPDQKDAAPRPTDPIAQQQFLNQTVSPSQLDWSNRPALGGSPLLNRSFGGSSVQSMHRPRLSLLRGSKPTSQSPVALALANATGQKSRNSQLSQVLDDSSVFKEGFVPKRQVKALVLPNASSPNNSNNASNLSAALTQRNSPQVTSSGFKVRQRPLSTQIDTSKAITTAKQNGHASASESTSSSVCNGATQKPVAARLAFNDSSLNSTGLTSPSAESTQPAAAAAPRQTVERPVDYNNSANLMDHDEIVDQNVEPTPPHPAGITLTKQEYYTIPSMDKLSLLTDQSGDCLVPDGFTVGRIGYGCVFWPGEFNVANLNLDEIVVFRAKEVTVYPDDSVKPPVGEGLNRPAEVTLEKIWPLEKDGSRAPIKDALRLKQMGYVDKLERAAASMNASFRDYRPESGSWVFEVPHFTKYGLSDDDEMELTDVIPAQPAYVKEQQLQAKVQRAKITSSPPPQQQQASLRVVSPGLGGCSFGDDDDEPDAACPDDLMMMTNAHDSSASALLLAQTAATASLLQHTLAECSAQETDLQLITGTSVLQQALHQSSLLVNRDRRVTQQQQSARGSQQPNAVPTAIPPKYKLCAVPHHKSLMYNKTSYITDAALFNGTRTRPGFTQQHAVVQPVEFRCALGRNQSMETYELGPLVIRHHPAVQRAVQRAVSRIDKHSMFYVESLLSAQVGVQQECAELLVEADCPQLRLPDAPSIHALHEHHRTALAHNESTDFEKSCWNLLLALYGDLQYNITEVNAHHEQQRRKQAVSLWLMQLLQTELDTQLAQVDDAPAPARVLTYLLFGHFRDAIDAALKAKLPRLAILLSASVNGLGRCGEAQDDAAAQLAHWTATDTTAQVESNTLEIFRLIAGDIKQTLKQRTQSWLHAFAIHLWFGTHSVEDVQDVLAAYDESCEERLCAAPAFAGSAHYSDVRYLLLRLYGDSSGVSLHQLLSTTTHTNNPCDLRLSWHMYQSLAAAGVRRLPVSDADNLCLQYAAQLVACPQPCLAAAAITVLLHINDPNTRKQMVEDVLNRQLAGRDDFDEQSDTWQLLTDQLGIPTAWLYLAKCTKAINDGAHGLAYACAKAANEWNTAHRLFVQHIAPVLIVNEDMERLEAELNELQPYAGQIEAWAMGAQIYCAFLVFITQCRETPAQPSAEQVNELRDQMTHLLRIVPPMPCSTPLQRLARSEMQIRARNMEHSLVRAAGIVPQQAHAANLDRDDAVQHARTIALDLLAS